MSGSKQKSRRRRIAFRAAAAGLATLFGLYVSETVLRILNWPVSVTEARGEGLDARAACAAKLGVPFDLREPLDVISDLRAQGRRAYPCGSIESYLGLGWLAPSEEALAEKPGVITSAVKVRGLPVLPLGHPSRTLLVGDNNENGYYRVFVTDERGFCNPPGIWKIDQADIVGLGDSFVEGCEVRDNESFMSRIRERVPRTVNLGLGGGGPLTALATLREYGKLLRPKVVLWCYYGGNDYNDATVQVQSPILMEYLNDDGFTQNLAGRQEGVDAAIRQFLEWEVQAARRMRAETSWGSYFALSRLRMAMIALASRTVTAVRSPPASEAAVLSVVRTVAVKMKALAESWGGRLYVVYLPGMGTLLRPPCWNETEQLRILRAMIEEQGLSFIDIATPLRNRPDRVDLLPFGMEGHFNATGNRIVADEILQVLEEDAAGPLHSTPPVTGHP